MEERGSEYSGNCDLFFPPAMLWMMAFFVVFSLAVYIGPRPIIPVKGMLPTEPGFTALLLGVYNRLARKPTPSGVG